jgi:hypothetical protein
MKNQLLGSGEDVRSVSVIAGCSGRIANCTEGHDVLLLNSLTFTET